ncbi:MAG: hypothetical protein K2F97_04935 [Muribaculaceae bacterium]|nr:hypothetical protein [Muribaculaceae bacterium]
MLANVTIFGDFCKFLLCFSKKFFEKSEKVSGRMQRRWPGGLFHVVSLFRGETVKQAKHGGASVVCVGAARKQENCGAGVRNFAARSRSGADCL